jgi:hypothetical protein
MRQCDPVTGRRSRRRNAPDARPTELSATSPRSRQRLRARTRARNRRSRADRFRSPLVLGCVRPYAQASPPRSLRRPVHDRIGVRQGLSHAAHIARYSARRQCAGRPSISTAMSWRAADQSALRQTSPKVKRQRHGVPPALLTPACARACRQYVERRDVGVPLGSSRLTEAL